MESSTSGAWSQRGWGYLVVLAAFSCAFLLDGMESSFGVLMPTLVDDLQGSVALTSFSGGLITGTALFVGPLVSMVIENYGCRPVALLGGLVCFVFLTLSTLSTSIAVFIFCYGIGTGAGIGMVYVSYVTVVNLYFPKSMSMAMGLVTSGSGVGILVMALLIETLIRQFGWRGCYLIIAAIYTHVCAFALLMRPLKQQPPPPSSSSSSSSSPGANGSHELIPDARAADGPRNGDSHNNSYSELPRGQSSVQEGDDAVWIYSEKSEKEIIPPPRHCNSLPDGGLRKCSARRQDLEPSSELQGQYYASVPSDAPLPSGIRKSPPDKEEEDEKEEEEGRETNRGDEEEEEEEDEKRRLQLTTSTDSQSRYHSGTGGEGPEEELTRRGTCPTGIEESPKVCYSKSENATSSTHDLAEVIQMSTSESLYQRPEFSAASLHSLCPSNSRSPHPHHHPHHQTQQNPQTPSRDASTSGPKRLLPPALTRLRDAVVCMRRRRRRTGSRREEEEESRPARPRSRVTPLRTPVFMLYCLGATLLQLAFAIVPMFAPSYGLHVVGLSPTQAASAVSAIGICNMAGRFLAGLLSFLGLGTVRVYVIGSGAAGVVCFLIPLCVTYVWFMVAAGGFGLAMGAFFPLQSVVLVELFGLEKLPRLFGVICFFRGLACMLGPLLAGFLYQVTSDVTTPFLLTGGTLLLATLLHVVMATLAGSNQ